MLNTEVPNQGRTAGGMAGRANPGGMMLNRAVDVVVALLGLLILLPILAANAIFVRLSSPGPVLFRQTRVGFQGKDFTLFKFRTMTVRSGSEKGTFDVGDGSLVTRFGRFLRATKLDELPQLWKASEAPWHSSVPVPRSASGSRTTI